jgi:hypothetical protein
MASLDGCGKYRKVSQVFNNNPQGGLQRGGPKKAEGGTVYKQINRCRITNWKERSQDRYDWEKSIKEAEFRIGL